MSNEQFKFPPSVKTVSYWTHRFTHDKESFGEFVTAIQRDAVIAERREVEVESNAPFSVRLTDLLTEYYATNASNTPPEILAEYLQNCLSAFNGAQQRRQEHFEQPKCDCTGIKSYYWRGNTRCCYRCNKPLRVQSV